MPLPTVPNHCSWFENTTSLQTIDGKEVPVIRFNHQNDDAVLKEWAIHFREHYSTDLETIDMASSMGLTPAEYLRDIKLPSLPGVRSGDFSEILVADYLQFLMNYEVPRTRYDRRPNRNGSTQGVDIIGFKIVAQSPSSDDELLTCEVKASLSQGRRANNNLQKAIDDSKKDFETRLPMALNATAQRLKDRQEVAQLETINRFMNITGVPYKRISGAVLMVNGSSWKDELVTTAVGTHPNINTVFLTFVGDDLMNLANRLYETAHATA